MHRSKRSLFDHLVGEQLHCARHLDANRAALPLKAEIDRCHRNRTRTGRPLELRQTSLSCFGIRPVMSANPTRTKIDSMLRLRSAGFAGPHVLSTMIGTMLRPDHARESGMSSLQHCGHAWTNNLFIGISSTPPRLFEVLDGYTL